MIKDYQPYLDQVKNIFLPMGFDLKKNEDFEAVFLNCEGWSVIFEGERYVRPAFDLSISKNGLKFSVRLLMEVFDVHVKPSLTEQLKFIDVKNKEIFIFPPPYFEKYKKINEIEI